MALKYAGIQVEHREIELRNKPESMLMASPKGTVPVLIIGDVVLDQSIEIMRWALQQSDPETGVGLMKMLLKFGLKRMIAPLRHCLINTNIQIGTPI